MLNKSMLGESLLIHPGESLQEILMNRNINESQLAALAGFSVKFISSVINGKKKISKRFAYKLESVLSIPFSFWLNLQKNYEKEVNNNEKL